MKLYIAICIIFFCGQALLVESTPMDIRGCYGEDCQIVRPPHELIRDIILFPIQPLIDAVRTIASTISGIARLFYVPIQILLSPVAVILHILNTPLRLFRGLIFLPLNLFLLPIRILHIIYGTMSHTVKLITNTLEFLFYLPYYLLTLPIRILVAPTRFFGWLFIIPEGLVSVPLYIMWRLVTLPFRIIWTVAFFPLRLLGYIISIPWYIMTFPLRVILFPLTIVRWIMETIMEVAPIIMPIPIAGFVRMMTLPLYIILKVIDFFHSLFHLDLFPLLHVFLG